MSTYRNGHSTNHVLIRFIKIWKTTLDKSLRKVLADYESDYDILLRKSGKVTIQIK